MWSSGPAEPDGVRPLAASRARDGRRDGGIHPSVGGRACSASPRRWRGRAAPVPFSAPNDVLVAFRNGVGLATETLTLYARLLGRYAGDLALVFEASGGVFIAGGIAPRMVDILQNGAFREAFDRKAPHDGWARRVFASVITHPSRARRAASAGRTRRGWKRCIIEVIHQENRSPSRRGAGAVGVARRGRRQSARIVVPISASARYATSLAARFRPLAPVGGTMWAASPARNSRPKRIGSATKLRSGAMLFSIDGPVTSASRPRRRGAGAARPRTRRRTSPRPVVERHCT